MRKMCYSGLQRPLCFHDETRIRGARTSDEMKDYAGMSPYAPSLYALARGVLTSGASAVASRAVLRLAKMIFRMVVVRRDSIVLLALFGNIPTAQ